MQTNFDVYQNIPSELNNGAVSWSVNGLIALGIKGAIYIVDSDTNQIIYTIKTNSIVTSLKWFNYI